MTRILVFSPYATRPFLSAYESTIARGCRVRGAKVEYLLCDGLLPECDMHWGSFAGGGGRFPRPPDLCETCRAGSEERIRPTGVPLSWLSDFVSPNELQRALDWANGLPAAEMEDADFNSYPVGRWVLSSVVSFFLRYPPDLQNWRVTTVYRGYLASAAVVATGLLNYLRSYPVDAALLFNGRQSVTRVAFEVMRKHGVRVATHETPFYRRGHLLVKSNARCWTLEPFLEFWDAWHRVPLARAQLEQTLAWARDRRYGLELSWYAYTTPRTREADIRTQFGLLPGRPIIALFTSSTHEMAGDPEWDGPYTTQTAWIEDVLDWVKSKPEIYLVIRPHPNVAGVGGLSRADEANYFDSLKSRTPPNCRVILPDDPITSYALADAADVGLTYGSTIGLEMAMQGKPIVLAGRGLYERGHTFLRVTERDELPGMLNRSLQRHDAREIRREAYRLAYYYAFMFEMPFPLVEVEDINKARPAFDDDSALVPGADASLDRICSHLVHGEPLHQTPTERDLARSQGEEDDFFAELETSPDALQDAHLDRWLPRLRRVGAVGRSARDRFSGMPFGHELNRVGRSTWRALVGWVEKGRQG